MIPESQNFEVVLRQERIASLVGDLPQRLVMLPAVDFDYEACRVTRKVDNYPVNRDLTSEMKSARLQLT